MATEVLRPNADVTNNWTKVGGPTKGWECIDDALTQPTDAETSGDGDHITGTTTAGTVQECDAGTFTLPEGNAVSKATLWVYCLTGPKRGIEVQLRTGTTNLGTAAQVGEKAAKGWRSQVYEGTLSQAEINALRARFVTTSTAGGGGAGAPTVFAAYIEVEHGKPGSGTKITGLRAPRRAWQGGPFKSSGGNYYAVGIGPYISAEEGEYLRVYKASDPNGSWSQVGGDKDTNRWDDPLGTLCATQSGDVLTIIGFDDGGDCAYWEFSMASDSWQEPEEPFESDYEYMAEGNFHALQVVPRTTASGGAGLIVLHTNATTFTPDTVTYARYVTTPETAFVDEIEASPTATAHTSPLLVKGADNKVHFFYRSAADSHIYHKSLSKGDSLSSQAQVSDNASAGTHPVLASGAYYDASGTERITVVWKRSSTGLLVSAEIDNDGTPGAEEAVSENAPAVVNGQPVGSVAVEGTTAYVLYADATDGNLYLVQNDNSGGWGTDEVVNEDEGITLVSARIVDENTLSYLYELGEAIYYDEIALEAGPTTHERSAAISATGTIAAAGLRAHLRASALTATGTIASAGEFFSTLERSAAVAATGAISAAGEAVAGVTEHERSASVEATGAIASAGTAFSVLSASASLSATATISAAPQRDLQRSSSLSATGSVESSGAFWSTLEREAALAAIAAVTSAGARVTAEHERSASMSATGSIASTGTAFSSFDRSAAISASGTVTTAGQRELLRAAAFAASAGVGASAEFWSTLARAAAISATGAIATAPQRDLLRSASAGATATIGSRGEVEGQPNVYTASASLSATGAVTATGQRDLLRSISIAATGTVTAAGEAESVFEVFERSASLSATGAVESAAEFWSVLERSAALSASGTITAAGLHELIRSAGVGATGTVSATGQTEQNRSASLSATASASATGTVVLAFEVAHLLIADQAATHLELRDTPATYAIVRERLAPQLLLKDSPATNLLLADSPSTHLNLKDGA